MKRLLELILLLACVISPPSAEAEPIPIFDAHLHYNREPDYRLPLDKVLALLRANRVTGILATSRPNDGTRLLVEAKPAGLQVVPFIRPYVVRADMQTWFSDPKIYELIEREFQRGYYRGIGEFHLQGRAAASPWVKKTLEFGIAHKLFLHAHVDDEALEILFSHAPAARIIWAHTGFSTPPDKVAVYLDRYPGLICELSYRAGITDGNGQLTPEWRRLFERYPERFLLGSDTWIAQRWDSYGEILAEYRGWLAQLPPAIATRIAHGNAEALFASPSR